MPIRSPTVVEAFRVRGAEGWLHGQRVRPRREAGPLPCVVMIPGGIGAGRTMVLRATARELAERGVLVAGFNARGRTSGRSIRSCTLITSAGRSVGSGAPQAEHEAGRCSMT